MLRSVLTWILTAAFLVTFPVTGAGPCPCRLVKALRTPTTEPLAFVPNTPPKCKCCHEPRGADSLAPPEADQPKPTPPAAPTDGPCDHRFTVDATVAGGPSHWLEESRGLWDANPAVDAVGHAAMCLAVGVVPTPVEPTHAPRPGAHLRYTHSFRC